MNDKEVVEKIEKVGAGVGIVAFIPRLVASVFFLLLGLVFLFFNVVLLIHYFTYIETEATIVDINYSEEEEGYVPVYEYSFNGTIVRTATSGSYEKLEDIKVGEKVIINYNPNNYHKFDVGSRKDSWSSWFVCAIFLFVSIASIVEFIKFIKTIKQYFASKKEQNAVINNGNI